MTTFHIKLFIFNLSSILCIYFFNYLIFPNENFNFEELNENGIISNWEFEDNEKKDYINLIEKYDLRLREYSDFVYDFKFIEIDKISDKNGENFLLFKEIEEKIKVDSTIIDNRLIDKINCLNKKEMEEKNWKNEKFFQLIYKNKYIVSNFSKYKNNTIFHNFFKMFIFLMNIQEINTENELKNFIYNENDYDSIKYLYLHSLNISKMFISIPKLKNKINFGIIRFDEKNKQNSYILKFLPFFDNGKFIIKISKSFIFNIDLIFFTIFENFIYFNLAAFFLGWIELKSTTTIIDDFLNSSIYISFIVYSFVAYIFFYENQKTFILVEIFWRKVSINYYIFFIWISIRFGQMTVRTFTMKKLFDCLLDFFIIYTIIFEFYSIFFLEIFRFVSKVFIGKILDSHFI